MLAVGQLFLFFHFMQYKFEMIDFQVDKFVLNKNMTEFGFNISSYRTFI